MKNIYEYLKFLDKDLIKKSKAIETIFGHFISYNCAHVNKKIWQSIIFYQELISLNVLMKNNSNFKNLLNWFALPTNKKKDNKWNSTSWIIEMGLIFIECKNNLKKNNKIDSSLLINFTNMIFTKKNISKDDYQLKNKLIDVVKSDNVLSEINDFLLNKDVKNEFGFFIQISIIFFHLLKITLLINENFISIPILFLDLLISNNDKTNLFKLSLSSYFCKNNNFNNRLFQNEFNKIDFNNFISYMLTAFSESCSNSNIILEQTNSIIDQNAKEMFNVLHDNTLFHSDYSHISNNFLLTKNSFKDVIEGNKNDSSKIVEVLLENKIIKKISKSNKNLFIYTNIEEYLLNLDKQFIKKH